MGKKYYVRIMQAGRFAKTVRYARSLPNDRAVARAEKAAATAKAQQYINIKNATERLELLLWANFDNKRACFCTFTFNNDKLPTTRKEVKTVFSSYMKLLRQDWKRQGRELKYIYTIEGASLGDSPSARPVDGEAWEIAPWRDAERWESLELGTAPGPSEHSARFHVHCFLLLEKPDFETVRALWRAGYVHINRMKVNEKTTFARLASYVTKERRNDEKPAGDRAYTPSLNLTQPDISGHWCEEWETIGAPTGATVIHSGREETEYSCYEYLTYILPRPQQQPEPYRSCGPIGGTGRRKRTK